MASAVGAGRGGGTVGLTLRQVCAVAYVLWLEELDRETVAHTQAALFARAMGAEADIPDPRQLRARFDELLAAGPAGVGERSRRQVLLEAFGVSGG